jgi:hypothetical protein
MKSVTEFPSFKLLQGLKTKTELTGAGKTPEEVQQALGETFKLEGDKLKYFSNALDVAGQNTEKLTRVIVVTFAEGESVPPKATKVEEHHYIPEFQAEPKGAGQKVQKGAGGKDKKGKGGPKESPWGLSPEQKAAKKGAGNKGAKPASTT